VTCFDRCQLPIMDGMFRVGCREEDESRDGVTHSEFREMMFSWDITVWFNYWR
jgi:hypothetical protein